jgi:hypothetical protein
MVYNVVGACLFTFNQFEDVSKGEGGRGTLLTSMGVLELKYIRLHALHSTEGVQMSTGSSQQA